MKFENLLKSVDQVTKVSRFTLFHRMILIVFLSLSLLVTKQRDPGKADEGFF